MYAVGRNFYFVDSAKREEQPDEVFRRILRGLLDDIPHRVRNGGMKCYAFDLHASEVDSNELSRLKRSFHLTVSILLPAVALVHLLSKRQIRRV
jgi:hypothetical protein